MMFLVQYIRPQRPRRQKKTYAEQATREKLLETVTQSANLHEFRSATSPRKRQNTSDEDPKFGNRGSNSTEVIPSRPSNQDAFLYHGSLPTMRLTHRPPIKPSHKRFSVSGQDGGTLPCENRVTPRKDRFSSMESVEAVGDERVREFEFGMTLLWLYTAVSKKLACQNFVEGEAHL